jgi:hypothetical protein
MSGLGIADIDESLLNLDCFDCVEDVVDDVDVDDDDGGGMEDIVLKFTRVVRAATLVSSFKY